MAGRMFIAESWRPLLERHRLASPESVWNASAGAVIKSAPSTEVRRLELGDARRKVVFLKKYWASTARQLWSGLFRGTFFGRTRVRREFDNLARIRDLGLHAPEPAAWGEIRRAGFVVRSFLITESVPGPVVSLDRFIAETLPGLPPKERRVRRRELIEHLADAVCRLHEVGFVHRDLYWRNIILARGGELDAFYLIDAHASRRRRNCLPWPERAADLAALDAPAPWFFNRPDRLRFYLRYVRRASFDERSRHEAIRDILRLADPIRNRQLGRVQRLRG